MSDLEEMGKSQAAKKPHACPVCGGRGIVPQGFYMPTYRPGELTSSGLATEGCHSCGGTGTVWG